MAILNNVINASWTRIGDEAGPDFITLVQSPGDKGLAATVRMVAGNEQSIAGNGEDSGEGMSRTPLLRQSPPMVALFTTGYVLVLVLAVVNNSLVLAAIYRNPQLRTVTNLFLANLAVADITVSLVVLPFTLLTNLFKEWLFGPFLCHAIPYLQGAAVGASVNTLAAVAVERYLAIFHPQTRLITYKKTLVLLCLIWMVPLCLQIPWAVFYHQKSYEFRGSAIPMCVVEFNSKELEQGFVLGVVFLTCYLIPLCLLAVFYSLIGIKVWKRDVSGIRGTKAEHNINKSKIRIVRMLIMVTAFFALSWLPFYCIHLIRIFNPEFSRTYKVILLQTLLPIFQWLGSANSCVNPFIYCYFCEQFRKTIVALFKGTTCCEKINI